MMDCNGHLPRLAFGHLDQDGCIAEGAQLTVDVAVAAVSGNRLCIFTLKEQNRVQHLKKRISSAIQVPETDQTLLLSNGQHLRAKRRLRSALPSRSEAVTLVISRPFLPSLRGSRWPVGTPCKAHSVRTLPRSL